MKILFVSSGNSNKVKTVVKNQADSLIAQGIEIHFFLIKGRGVLGYLKNIFYLKKILNKTHFDIIHAHYSLSAFVASLAGAKPLVVSLMGSDVKSGFLYKKLIQLFYIIFSWRILIVKSQDMKKSLGIKSAHIIPNGVDINHFKPLNKIECQEKLNWDERFQHILFAADPKRSEKNYILAEESIKLTQNNSIQIHILENVSFSEMPLWFNASDLVLLTSLWEGSPNVIKEAMACNRPIVATDVGDVRKVIGNTEGCYVTSFNANEVKENLLKALAFGEITNGRENIKYLDSILVAQKIIDLYQLVLSNKAK